MELWQQLLVAGMGLLMLIYLFPSIKPMMEKSKNAEEKHWGTATLLAIVLIAFILLMIYSVQ